MKLQTKNATVIRSKGGDMKWTKEKPTQPGWYWWRDKYSSDIVHVTEDSGMLVVKLGFDIEDFIIDLSGEWAGPICPPEE